MKTNRDRITKFGNYYGKCVDGAYEVYSHRQAAEDEDNGEMESCFTRDDVISAIALMKFVGSAGVAGVPAFNQTGQIGTVRVNISYPALAGSDAARWLLLKSGDNVLKVTGESCFIGCTLITLAQAKSVLRLLS